MRIMRRIIILLLCLFATNSWSNEEVTPLSKDEWKRLTSIMYQLQAKSPDTVWEQYNSNFYDYAKNEKIPAGDFTDKIKHEPLINHFKRWVESELSDYHPNKLSEDALITLPKLIQNKSTIDSSYVSYFVRLPFCDPNVLCFTVIVPFKEYVSTQYLITANRKGIIDAAVLSINAYWGREICNDKTCARTGIGSLFDFGYPDQKWSPPEGTLYFPVILSEDIYGSLPREDVKRYYYLSPNGNITLARQKCYSIYPIDYLENGGDIMVPSCRQEMIQRIKRTEEKKLLRKSQGYH